jgi:hypothetical protein
LEILCLSCGVWFLVLFISNHSSQKTGGYKFQQVLLWMKSSDLYGEKSQVKFHLHKNYLLIRLQNFLLSCFTEVVLRHIRAVGFSEFNMKTLFVNETFQRNNELWELFRHILGFFLIPRNFNNKFQGIVLIQNKLILGTRALDKRARKKINVYIRAVCKK